MGRRITRKQLKEDEFVSTVDQLIRRFGEYWKPAAVALGAVLVVVFLWWVGSEWSSSRAAKASATLQVAVEGYQTAMLQQPPGDLGAAETGFREVAERFGRTAQADVARLYLARIALQRGDVDDARSALIRLADRNRDTALGQLVALDLIKLRIASGQGSEVASELESMVVGRGGELPRDVALYELAEVYREEQQPEQAREYYQKLVDEFPESAYSAPARQRLGELG
jgi:predicted negative regulator of RcsB-dependent stress response